MAPSALMSMVRRYWRVNVDQPELLIAQYRAFAGKMPMMYLILLINTWGLAYTYLGLVPLWLGLYFPVLLTVLCVIRISFWWRGRHVDPTPGMAAAALKRTNLLAPPIALSFSLWSVLLFPYGDSYAQAHVAFYMGITVICCIFCLMYLRSAALSVALIVNGIFTLFFLATHIPTFVAAAMNVVLVTLGMLAIVNSHYNDFRRLIDAQVKTTLLGNENLRLANLDSLTQIPNRRKFFAQLDQICSRATANGQRFAVAILDLDGFKAVNDLYGHTHGDQLLVEVGQRLSALCGEEYLHLARLGGDEFAIIIDAGQSDDVLQQFGARICDALRRPFVLYKATVQIAASVGVATFPDMAVDASSLYEHADYALYQGKRERRGTVTLFSAQDKAQIQRNANVEQALRRADFERELSVVFQPIVRLDDCQPVAFEALARWHSATKGVVAPMEFIPAAERMGIINQLSVTLLKKALQAAATWPPDMRLSFNLSANDINTSEGMSEIVKVITGSGFCASRLDLEITETAVLQDLGKSRQLVTSLRQLGCGITLDDFGTGYASLSHLHALPLTRIKIDKSFVADIEHDAVSHKIIKSLLALSHDMQLACVVEGVETPQHLQSLRELGAVYGQGYLFSVPLAADQVQSWLEHQTQCGCMGLTA
ncbi:GGDEF domain/EAL domain signal transduction protein [Herbaspirillum rubrisubalbicans M1]|uniref:putative bifunctional diguanylate cyclase/phosphodiesterase n=1 Tax=Herbaspirillum rubrisubalbicans TaxID=80842 RepID=UPI00073A198F|nr:EAL domain-containing protein [Herbaspirillum rubrisubalbicans]ALU87757.1 GGDEF domain/EAL domain signal transduction protein [Herbaspirillum rubrisubalbicans M1]